MEHSREVALSFDEREAIVEVQIKESLENLP
jgi:hypothetical protein